MMTRKSFLGVLGLGAFAARLPGGTADVAAATPEPLSTPSKQDLFADPAAYLKQCEAYDGAFGVDDSVSWYSRYLRRCARYDLFAKYGIYA